MMRSVLCDIARPIARTVWRRPSIDPLLRAIQDIAVTGINAAIYDPSVRSSLWEDSSRTVQASIDGVVGAIDDLSGNGHHLIQATTANKPILKTDGMLFWLESDGSNDMLRTAATVDLTSVDKMFVCMAFENSTGNTTPQKFLFSFGVYAGGLGRCDMGANVVAAGDVVWHLGDFGGTEAEGLFSSSSFGTPPNTWVNCVQFDFGAADSPATGKIAPRINSLVGGTDFTLSDAGGDTDPQNFGDHTYMLFDNYATALFNLKAKFYGGVVVPRSTKLSGDEVDTIEAWSAARSGVTLS